MQDFWRLTIIGRDGKQLFCRDYFGKTRYCPHCGRSHARPTLLMRLQIAWDFMSNARRLSGTDGFAELCAMEDDKAYERLRQVFWFANKRRYRKYYPGRPPWLTGGETS